MDDGYNVNWQFKKIADTAKIAGVHWQSIHKWCKLSLICTKPGKLSKAQGGNQENG